jgi:hypothetical protein
MVGERRGEERYGERNAGGEKKKYEVKIEIHKARHEKEVCVNQGRQRPSPPINDTMRHKYLQYKWSRSRMTWPP